MSFLHKAKTVKTVAGSALILAFTPQLIAGSVVKSTPASDRAVGSGVVTRVPSDAAATVVWREIKDPSSGAHWLLLKNPEAGAGPGRLVLVDGQTSSKTTSAREKQVPEQPLPVVIHLGDTVTVEEHTATSDVQLQGVAMEPAQNGSPLRVRLKLRGKVVRTVALGPGRARLAPEVEAQ